MKREYNAQELYKVIKQPQPGKIKKEIINKYVGFQNIAQLGAFFYAFIDMASLKFLYVSPSVQKVVGYSANEFMKGGAEFALKKYHPDVLLTQKAIHIKVTNFLESLPVRTRTKYIYTYDVTFKSKKGDYVKLLQVNHCIKLDKYGLPSCVFLMCIDITHFKTDSHQVLVISKITKNGLSNVLKDEFYPEYENGILTKKETEVWRLTKLGLSGKELSAQLGISGHTVNTHRKNIYKKLKANS